MAGAVDHNAHDAVVLAYSLYQESLKPGYVMADLIKILSNEGSEKRDREKTPEDKREKTTDELFIQYQVPAMEHAANLADRNTSNSSGPSALNSSTLDPSRASRTAPENRDAMLAAVSKPNKRKHVRVKFLSVEKK